MALITKTVTFDITPGITITLDAEDLQRVRKLKWQASLPGLPRPGTPIFFYTNIGTQAKPHYLPLTNFILDAPQSIYVEPIDKSSLGLDVRKENLRASR